MRWLFDTQSIQSQEFQCNDLVMDLSDVPSLIHDEEYYGIANLLNVYIAVRTHVNVRSFLYVDSALLSVDR